MNSWTKSSSALELKLKLEPVVQSFACKKNLLAVETQEGGDVSKLTLRKGETCLLAGLTMEIH